MREKLEMYIHPNRIWFGMGFRLFQYEDSESGCLRNGQLLHGVRFEDAVLAHLNSYTSKPKLTFEKLKINTPSQNSYNYSRFLNKFQQKYANTPLKVEYLKLRGPHCKEKEFIDFVAYMDSEVLKSLEFLPSGSVRYQGIVEMVQWRNLKLFCTRASFLSQLPFESYAHIPEFSIDLSGDLDDEWMVRLIKVISFISLLNSYPFPALAAMLHLPISASLSWRWYGMDLGCDATRATMANHCSWIQSFVYRLAKSEVSGIDDNWWIACEGEALDDGRDEGVHEEMKREKEL